MVCLVDDERIADDEVRIRLSVTFFLNTIFSLGSIMRNRFIIDRQ
jgi:hypothetical protein